MDGMEETQLRLLAVSFSFEFAEKTSELWISLPAMRAVIRHSIEIRSFPQLA
jgi:hypothetical protein